MPPVSQVAAFAAVVAVVIAIPGPSVLFTISRALTASRTCALLTVTGNAAGVYLQVAAVAAGIGTLVERSLPAFTLIKWAGAAYLCYLGVQALRHRHSLAEALAAKLAPIPPRRAVRDGFVAGVTNPKTIVFFVAVMPQFASPAAGHLPLQMLLLGAVFPVIALVLDSCWALAAGAARDRLATSPRRLAMIGGTGGLAMIGLGMTLAVTGHHD
jgi:threonine/homoserine/homoserine lactone efflux protein